MTIRLLAPAAPVLAGRDATVRASVRTCPSTVISTRWAWGDGRADTADLRWAGLVHAGARHRYAEAGVYRVQVRSEATGCPTDVEARYVAVRGSRRDAAASGWIREVGGGDRVAFGFVLPPADGSRGRPAIVRAAIAGAELRADRAVWVLEGKRGSFHFGGVAAFGPRPGHPYRVDVVPPDGGGARRGPSVALTVYAPGATPGRDSPLHRISGAVRPGRVVLPRLQASP